MKKFLFLLIFTTLILGGCNKEAQIQDYVSKADKYRKEGRLEDAISLYNKALDIKEDNKIRNKLRDTEAEKETVEKVKSVLDTFAEVEKYYLQDTDYISPTTIEEATDKLRPAIDELEQLDGSAGTDIDSFVKQIKDSYDYKIVKEYVESPVTNDSQTMEDLGFVFSDFQKLNEVGADLFKIIGTNIENIANMKIPDKYQKN
ncbi:tetratricopeptide repeat protein [Thermaerobacillus caldiproteolyticus]|uniref:hypothetical protein n=1 Tax=Thermaerobacillus caldiproteolyticus TaxID=247480 RepID=UPI00188C05C5|nr:hypothetical protein [Anoxybacillus caldiproteolyticus]QPA31426.1 hypothetical protein ISX45_18710 [Anoxybacillus caldiproteolyticus]